VFSAPFGSVLSLLLPHCCHFHQAPRDGIGHARITWRRSKPNEEEVAQVTLERPPSAEERFDELFKAAKILLELDAEEDQIIPTLALANQIGEGVWHLVAERTRFVKVGEDGEAWNKEMDNFVRRYRSLRPVRVIDGVLILERLPVSIEVEYDPDNEVPEEVVLRVYAHQRLAEPEDVTFRYEKALEDAGIAHDEKRTAHMSFDYYGRSLILMMRPGSIAKELEPPERGWQIDTTSFPHPRLVQTFYSMLLGAPSGEGFRKELAIRTRGGPTEAINLVPACVAYYLRKYGKIYSRKEIHRLLNKHVLCETQKTLPEKGYSNSETNQLWRDVNDRAKVGNPLSYAAYILFLEGDE
jgi:hypothetical protein